MKNAEWMIKNGYKFSDLELETRGSEFKIYLKDDVIGQYPQGFTMYDAAMKWLDAEHVEPILDDAEREYISAVIKPFRDRVMFIEKMFEDHLLGDQDCYLFIRFNDGNYDMNFPVFRESIMYKGMERYKKYTLEELGL